MIKCRLIRPGKNGGPIEPQILKLFNQGRYKEIINLWETAPFSKKLGPLSGTLVVGSLCFLGKRWEAEEIDLNDVNTVGRNFFLGIALTRESKYQEAHKVFTKNTRLSKNSSDDLTQFFSHQGQGFYRFFTGQSHDLLESAEKSYRAALRAQFSWGQVMALDLVAHGLFAHGRVQESLSTFDQVIEKSLALQAHNLASSYAVSKACYLSQISDNPVHALADLKIIEQSLTSQDTFSLNAIRLEMFRQFIHHGQFNEAREWFSRESPGFYKTKNRRQIAVMLNRYAYLLTLQGSNIEALAVIRSARMNLVEEVDRLHLLRSYGLEKKILQNSKTTDAELIKDVQNHIDKLEAQIPTFIGHRIKNRIAQKIQPIYSHGQDPLGDLLDATRTSPMAALKKMIYLKLWGLIPSTMGWDPSINRILLDVEDSYALIQYNSHCFLSDKQIKGYPRKVLELLRESNHLTKAQLIEQAWGYTYEANRHDPILHSTLHQLRTQLGSNIQFFELTSNGYQLNITVLDLKHKQSNNETLPPIVQQNLQSTSIFSLPNNLKHLNGRQIGLLRTHEPGMTMDVRTYCQIYSVSHMTAFRDLTLLTKENLFQKIGQGRSTCYIRSEAEGKK